MSLDIYNWDIFGGSHIQYCGNLENTVKSGITQGMSSCQFFLGNPQSFTRSKVSDKDIEQAKRLKDRYNILCFSHAPYIHNLCGSKGCLCWQGNTEQDLKTTASIKSLEYEMDILGQLGGGVVVHPGVYGDRKKGIETIKKSIEKINFKSHSKLLLENSAGQGDSLGITLQELRDMVPDDKKENVRFCLDTAHLWGVGEYDLRKNKEIDRLFSEIETTLGLENIALIHLNDSHVDIKSRKDRHELIGKGKIWEKDNTSFKFLLSKLEKNKIPFVLETDPTDYRLVYELYKK